MKRLLSALIYWGMTVPSFPRMLLRAVPSKFVFDWEKVMAVRGNCLTEVTQFIRRLRGGSQPILVEASDGMRYVVKFADNIQGSNLAFNEAMGTELYRACGLTVPLWKPLLLTDSFLDRNPACWMQTERGLLRPAAGRCFGSRFLGTVGTRLLEILPETSYRRLRNRTSFWLAWLVDICAEHADNRQALFLQQADGCFEAHYVDQGHVFGGPNGNQRVHYIASRYLDSRIYPAITRDERRGIRKALRALDAESLLRVANALPDEWKMVSALDSLGRCLQRLSKELLLENLLETMIDSSVRGMGSERRIPENARKGPTSVLCPGIQLGVGMPDFTARRQGYFACRQG
jgi:hypothetical protein